MHYERVTSCGTRAPLPFNAERVSLGQNSHHSEVMPESQVPSRATKSAGYALIRHVLQSLAITDHGMETDGIRGDLIVADLGSLLYSNTAEAGYLIRLCLPGLLPVVIE